jgi:hypothetical protein
MRKEAVSLAALLFGAVLAFGQQPAPAAGDKTDQGKEQPAKSKLEEMLEKALHNNPDVRLAEAKVAEAEAELNRARLQVVQKVASAYQAVEAQRAAVEGAATQLAELKRTPGAVSQAELRTAEQQLIDAKAKLADLESQLPYLLGQQTVTVSQARIDVWLKAAHDPPGTDAGGAYDEFIRRYYLDLYGRLPTPEELAAGGKPTVQGPTADRIRAALDRPFSYECKDKPINEVLRDLSKAFQETNQGLLIKDKWRNDGPLASDSPPALTVRFDHMPFGAVLEWVEDSAPPYAPEEGGAFRFVVRDYGLVLVVRDQAPPGAPLLRDFWKGAKADDKTPPSGAKDEPAKPPTGLVKDVDEAGRVHINIGKNDGLAKGDILTVSRIRQEAEVPLPLFVGRVRVVELGDGDAVAEPLDALKMAIVPGDKVRRDQGK